MANYPVKREARPDGGRHGDIAEPPSWAEIGVTIAEGGGFLGAGESV